jgi:uncharacterized phage-associated protein
MSKNSKIIPNIDASMEQVAKNVVKEKKVYDAIKIAEYIIAIANRNGDTITNLKLQKLLYYAQAWHLVKFKRKLFKDKIEAWQYGPVVRAVYYKYNENGRAPIIILGTDDEFDRNISEYINALDNDTREFMDYFLEEFMDYSASSLVAFIHKEEPWLNAFDEDNPYASKEISTKDMQNFYKKYFRPKEELEKSLNIHVI